MSPDVYLSSVPSAEGFTSLSRRETMSREDSPSAWALKLGMMRWRLLSKRYSLRLSCALASSRETVRVCLARRSRNLINFLFCRASSISLSKSSISARMNSLPSGDCTMRFSLCARLRRLVTPLARFDTLIVFTARTPLHE